MSPSFMIAEREMKMPVTYYYVRSWILFETVWGIYVKKKTMVKFHGFWSSRKFLIHWLTQKTYEKVTTFL